VEHGFLSAWQRYNRILQQRNAILRQKAVSQIAIWDAQFVDAALILNQFRVNYVENLVRLAQEYMQQLLNIDRVEFSYHSGWRQDEDFKHSLEASIESDMKLGFTQKGPHRADLVMKIDGRAAAEYLSGGQQKLAACSMMLSQASLFNQYNQDGCIILVDDLPSELDLEHRCLFMDLLYSIGGQVFVTATDINLLQLNAYSERKVFHVKHGELCAEREDGV
jgi:DNA replication and repair protein RecF